MVKVYSIGGLAALNLLFTGVILLAFVLVYRSMEGNPFAVAGVLVLAAGASEIYWSARPQLFTFLFSAGFYLILRKFLWGKKNFLWILPLIMALWVNSAPRVRGRLHPGGDRLGGARGQLPCPAGRPARKPARRLIWLAGILLACLAAACINPRGPAVLAYPFQTVSIHFLQNFIQEWKSPDFHYLEAQFFLILFVLTWAVIAFSPKKFESDDFFFLAIVGYMGFLAWRNTNLLSIVAPAIILRYGQPLIEKLLPDWNPDSCGLAGSIRHPHRGGDHPRGGDVDLWRFRPVAGIAAGRRPPAGARRRRRLSGGASGSGASLQCLQFRVLPVVEASVDAGLRRRAHRSLR